MKRGKMAPTLLALVLMSILIIGTGCQSSKPTTTDQPKNVQVEKAAAGSITVYEEYGGRLTPVEEVNVASTISGRVDEVFLDTGDLVNKGQTLFTLKTDAQTINQAQAVVAQAQLQYDFTRDLYTKTQALFTNGAVSQLELDKVAKDFNSAQVQLDSARSNLSLVSSSAGSSNLAVPAPISGAISACNIEPGEMTSAAVPAFTIINPRAVYLEIMVSDKKITNLTPGQTLNVVIDSLENIELQGQVDMISPNVDPRTKLFAVKIKFPQPSDQMRPGLVARVLVPVEHQGNVLQVRNQAIVVEQGVTMVYTVDSGVVHKKAVKTGIATADRTEIRAGLEDGEQVIIEGQHLLQAGNLVNAVLVGEGAQP